MSLTELLDIEDDGVPLEHYTLACVLTQWIEDGRDPDDLMRAMRQCDEIFALEIETVH